MDREFFRRHGLEVAPELLGLLLVHEKEEGITAGRIVEVEAYIGPEDRASHAYGGRRTPRNEAMYGPPGHAYVYFTYGMHHCLNVVCSEEGTPHAVLIRSVEPVAGVRLMAQRRGLLQRYNQLLSRDQSSPEAVPLKLAKLLCSGPGRLCQSFGITLLQNGADLVRGNLYLAFPSATGLPSRSEVVATKRIGIDYAGEARDYPWRFYLDSSPCVSSPKR